MDWRDRQENIKLGLIVGAITAIVVLIGAIGLFGLICSKYIVNNKSNAVIVEENRAVLKAVEQDLLKHGKIGKVKE